MKVWIANPLLSSCSFLSQSGHILDKSTEAHFVSCEHLTHFSVYDTLSGILRYFLDIFMCLVVFFDR